MIRVKEVAEKMRLLHVDRSFNTLAARRPRPAEPMLLAPVWNAALTSMEGGVMLSRTHRTPDAFDDAVRRYRDYLERLQLEAAR